MATRLRGRWALGITPRNFTWILKDKLAICERPGGYGDNHRRVRRQEEIIWIRENGFGCVVSIIPAPHNLHNYEELGVASRHRPFNGDDLETWLKAFYRELHDLLRSGTKVVVHGEEVGDRIVGHHRRLHPLGRPGRRRHPGHHGHRAPRRPPARPVRPQRHPDRAQAALTARVTPSPRTRAPADH